METLFDLLSIKLFVAATLIFFYRLKRENSPLTPYMLIALVCAVSNWLGNHGFGIAAIALLVTASFYLLHLAGEPYAEDGENTL